MKEPRPDMPLTSLVYKNVESFIKRASLMGYIGENKDKVRQKSSRLDSHDSPASDHEPVAHVQNINSTPAFHAIVNLISQATAPACLAQMGENFMAWY
jgi:transformation/transcription domain-associated protein